MPISYLSTVPDYTDTVVRLRQDDVRMLVTPPVDGKTDLGKGELVLTESKIYFHNPTAPFTITLDYPSVIIHALTRQDSQPCIYCQLDENVRLPGQESARDDEEQGEEEEEYPMTEIKFLPDDDSSLEDIYLAFSDCAALHPDYGFMDADGEDEYDDGGEWYTEASGEEELSEVGRAALAHLQGLLPPDEGGANGNSINDIEMDEGGRFRDADEQ